MGTILRWLGVEKTADVSEFSLFSIFCENLRFFEYKHVLMAFNEYKTSRNEFPSSYRWKLSGHMPKLAQNKLFYDISTLWARPGPMTSLWRHHDVIVGPIWYKFIFVSSFIIFSKRTSIYAFFGLILSIIFWVGNLAHHRVVTLTPR